eukprot:TRINITY_DN67219_c5_g1_i1.p1 TRINITY_DN67219_c5_g1~~TRINITY_DN67219_c5_g1_i1.p1  ORF type:complete len:125 (-),score=9.17 TRINITY_DN67219_c5_g1_i1:276-650(-)
MFPEEYKEAIKVDGTQLWNVSKRPVNLVLEALKEAGYACELERLQTPKLDLLRYPKYYKWQKAIYPTQPTNCVSETDALYPQAYHAHQHLARIPSPAHQHLARIPSPPCGLVSIPPCTFLPMVH